METLAGSIPQASTDEINFRDVKRKNPRVLRSNMEISLLYYATMFYYRVSWLNNTRNECVNVAFCSTDVAAFLQLFRPHPWSTETSNAVTLPRLSRYESCYTMIQFDLTKERVRSFVSKIAIIRWMPKEDVFSVVGSVITSKRRIVIMITTQTALVHSFRYFDDIGYKG